MTVNQVNAALGENFSTPKDKDEQTCFYVEPRQRRDTGIMILNHRVARLDVFTPPLINNVGHSVGVVNQNYAFGKDKEVHYYTPR